MNESIDSTERAIHNNTVSSPSKSLVIITVVFVFISVVGTTGNGLVIMVVKRLQHHGKRSNVHTFLLHLALSDLLVCIVCIPLTILVNFLPAKAHSLSSNITCKTMRFLQFLAPTISIMLLTVISIDRYFAVVRPLHNKIFLRKPKVMVCIAWLISIIQFLPTFHFSKVVNLKRNNHTIGYCTPIPYNTKSGYGFLLFVAIFSFVLPLIIISLMYGLIIRVVWFRHQQLNETSSTNRNNGEQLFRKSKKKVLQMLMIVVVAFICCWLPFVIYCGFIEVNTATFPNPVDIVRIATYCLALFNSILNPFIYFFSNTLLRNACIDLVFCRKFTMPSTSNFGIGSPSLTKKLSSTRLSLSPNMNTYLTDRRGRHSVHSMLLAKADNSKDPSPLGRTRRLNNGLGASLRRQGSLPIIAMSDSPWMRRAADSRLSPGVDNVGRMPKQLPTRTTMEDREMTTFI